MTNKVERNWHLSETLFKDLNLDPDRKVEKVKVVECPDEFVKTKMRVQIWKDDEGNDKRFQPINMKNPISGMSMSGDEGRTWTTMNHFGETDSFLRPSELSRTSKQTIRVEGWIGGSNVLISSQSGSLWTAGQDGSDGGNNICRGIFRFIQVILKIYSLQEFYSQNVFTSKVSYIRCLQASWDCLDGMEQMQWILWRRRDHIPVKKSCSRSWKILH